MLKHQVNYHEPVIYIRTCTRALTLLGAKNINHGRYKLRQPLHRHPINHPFNLIESMLPLLKSSAHEPGATVIRIEFLSSWRGISNTHRIGPCQGRTSHLWCNSGVMGSTDATSPWATLCQVIGTLPSLVSRQCPQAHPYLLQDATYPSIPGPNCITRLRGQTGLSGQLSVRLRST
jgi:hypothetical protein